MTVEVKRQAGIKAGDALDLDVEAGRFHLFGEDERLIAQSERQPVWLGVDRAA